MKLFSKLSTAAACLLAVVAMGFASCSSSDDGVNINLPQTTTVTAYRDTPTKEVSFSTNGTWTSRINTTEDWISYTPESGTGSDSYTITITLEPNNTGNVRHAVITINCDGQERIINVSQSTMSIAESQEGTFFIGVAGESNDYIITVSDITVGSVNITNNMAELEQSGYTWIFNDTYAVGLVYNQGDPGIGLGYKANSNKTISKVGDFQITSRFTSYGFYDAYALTSVGGQTWADEDGNYATYEDGTQRKDAAIFNVINLGAFSLTEKVYPTYQMTGNNEQATFSGIVDMGNGEFLTGMVVSQAIDESATGGSSTGVINSPDSVWVASFSLDANLNPVLNRIYRDNRLSYSSGRYRSQYYSQISKADDGTVYVFSGSYESTTTKPCGALRINSGATEFDQSYYFNIEAQSSGYRFRRVWHIMGDYFMLEFYNETGSPTSTLNPATQYGIVNMTTQSFTWVTGLPHMNNIGSTGLPVTYNDKLYLPVVENADDSIPTIYIIEPTTGVATAGLQVTGASTIRSVGYMKY